LDKDDSRLRTEDNKLTEVHVKMAFKMAGHVKVCELHEFVYNDSHPLVMTLCQAARPSATANGADRLMVNMCV